MKELKKILNKSSDIVYNFLKKMSNYIKNDKNTLVIKTIIKVIVLIIIYFFIGLISKLVINIGSYIIYQVGTTARGLLSNIWLIVVNFTYYLFIIVSLYKLNELSNEDKKFLTIYKDLKKNTEAKKKIYFTIDSIVKILGTIILIPLFIVVIGLLFFFGIMVGYWRQGIYLYSLFGLILGLIIFFAVVIFIIKNLLSRIKNIYKRYLYLIIIAGLLVAFSCIGLLFETSKYESIDSLTSDFSAMMMKYEYKIESDKNYIIKNNDYDNNIKLIIDDDLGSYMDISVVHYTTNDVRTKLKETNNNVVIDYDEELDLEVKDIDKLLNLCISSIKDKKLYNYSLLKYAQIEVRVSSEYAKNIKFVSKSGREYSPYERNN